MFLIALKNYSGELGALEGTKIGEFKRPSVGHGEVFRSEGLCNGNHFWTVCEGAHAKDPKNFESD